MKQNTHKKFKMRFSYLIPHTSHLSPRSRSRAFGLVEVVVGTAVFLTIALASYNAYISLFKLVDLSQYRVLATALANEQFEIARNMPYDDVGVQGSIPPGNIPHIQTLARGGTLFTVTSIVRNIDLAFDGTIGGSPNDLSPADNKKIQVTVSCDDCRGMQPITLTGQVAPKNLETASTNGALFVRVFDANGQPLQGVNVHVENIATTTTIVINDVTDSNGMLQLVDVPPDNNAYRITVSKDGYSSDRTYPIDTVNNPIPPKPDATVLIQQVTQVSFAIDRVSTVHVSSVTPTCEAVGNFDFSLTGGKENGPGMPKYGANHATDSNGLLDLNSLEWDIYTLGLIDTTHDLIGVNPLNPFIVNPDSDLNVQLIVAPKDPQSLLVTVKDSVTQLPLSGASVRLTGPNGYDETFMTGRGYINQTDWSGGAGQTQYTNSAMYDSGVNVDTATSSGQVVLRDVFGLYSATGELISSTFDTGSDSNFYSLIWTPNDQPALAGPNSVRMQFATAASTSPTGPWNFVGPDGTDTTYYTSSNSSLSAVHTDHQYARYKLFFSTDDTSVTPNVSDVSFTYTSSCVPPGQVIFSALSNNESYTATISKTGYTTQVIEIPINAAWAEQQVLLAP